MLAITFTEVLGIVQKLAQSLKCIQRRVVFLSAHFSENYFKKARGNARNDRRNVRNVKKMGKQKLFNPFSLEKL